MFRYNHRKKFQKCIGGYYNIDTNTMKILHHNDYTDKRLHNNLILLLLIQLYLNVTNLSLINITSVYKLSCRVIVMSIVMTNLIVLLCLSILLTMYAYASS